VIAQAEEQYPALGVLKDCEHDHLGLEVNDMRNLLYGLTAAWFLLAVPAGGEAAPLDNGIWRADGVAPIETVQFIWGGRNYCWYDSGWRGPGWYWCGYDGRRGLGWGGVYGWHGWRRDGFDHDRDHVRHGEGHHGEGHHGGGHHR
jgi:hypothetical protein